jgi:hypothetical protein
MRTRGITCSTVDGCPVTRARAYTYYIRRSMCALFVLGSLVTRKKYTARCRLNCTIYIYIYNFFLGGRRGTRTPKHCVNITGESKNFKVLELSLNQLQTQWRNQDFFRGGGGGGGFTQKIFRAG